MIVYGKDTLRLFEFDKLCERIVHYCRCHSSRQLAENLLPIASREELIHALKQTEEFRLALSDQGYFPDFLFEEFADEASLLKKPGSMLAEIQFSLIRSASRIVNDVLQFLDTRQTVFPNLLLLTGNVYITGEIEEQISQVIDEHSIVKDHASDELYDIRSRLNSKRREADRLFRSFISHLRKKGWLRDNEENFYNNRRVLAVPSEYKREIKGLIHGKSDTGKTTFIEPEALVGLNNEISELEQDERSEVVRLLRELTDQLRLHAPLIQGYHDFLSGLDFVRAKALFALELKASLPQIEKGSILCLYDAVHPLLYLQNKSQNKAVVPLSLELDQDRRMLIISGPNAGGKSITLKTVGMLQLMLQSGLLVPAAPKSRMSFFQNFLSDIGDSQSIEYALSTYSSRLISMNQFLREADNKSLVLIDEFGTGTDPELGGAIAEVVLEEINKKKAFGVLTTHYTNIKLLADELEGVVNGSMLFDPASLQPMYRLLVGQPGSSYTFEVAEKIGLPSFVLERAREKVSSEKIKLNNMLADLHRQKNRLEQELRLALIQQKEAEDESGRFFQLTKKLSENMESEKERRAELGRLAQLGRKYEALSVEWDQAKDKKGIIKKFVGSMTADKKKRASERAPEKLEKKRKALLERLRNEIVVGSKVRMLKGKQTGIVEKIKKDVVYVNFGTMMAEVALENLEPAE